VALLGAHPILHVSRIRVKSNITSIKFLGIMMDNTLMQKSHIEMVITKLSAACCVVRSVKPFVKQVPLKMVYHSTFHSVVNYGKIFRGNSPYGNSIFKLQKRIIRIIVGA
jgi:hypothetical protein